MKKVPWVIFWVIVGAAGVAVLAFLVACFGLATRGVEKDKVGDMATWMGAFASFSAAAIALWIAGSDARARRAAEVERANLSIASMRYRISDAAILCKLLLEWINKIEGNSISVEAQRSAFEKEFSNAKLWAVDELVPLAVLPGSLAIRLGEAESDMRRITEYLGKTRFEYAMSNRQFMRIVRYTVEGTTKRLNDAFIQTSIERPPVGSRPSVI